MLAGAVAGASPQCSSCVLATMGRLLQRNAAGQSHLGVAFTSLLVSGACRCAHNDSGHLHRATAYVVLVVLHLMQIQGRIWAKCREEMCVQCTPLIAVGVGVTAISANVRAPSQLLCRLEWKCSSCHECSGGCHHCIDHSVHYRS